MSDYTDTLKRAFTDLAEAGTPKEEVVRRNLEAWSEAISPLVSEMKIITDEIEREKHNGKLPGRAFDPRLKRKKGKVSWR